MSILAPWGSSVIQQAFSKVRGRENNECAKEEKK